MSIQDIIEGKEWKMRTVSKRFLKIIRLFIKRFKNIFKVYPVELNEGTGLLSGIVDLFEEGHWGKGVLEVTGSDVAAFCDDLIKDSKTYADIYQESVDQEVNKAMKKAINKTK